MLKHDNNKNIKLTLAFLIICVIISIQLNCLQYISYIINYKEEIICLNK